ncbi:MAG TPA: sugar ABC transporter permease [Clostridiaceae bacterium]|nr:sugar ABC transporter permease [Clostridiaceae bacterium]
MKLTDIKKDFKENKVIYLMLSPIIAYFIIFSYVPMSGLLMAFQDYSPAGGIFASKWVGFKHFIDFFNNIYFSRLIRNTFLLSFYDMLFGFPAPIIFALLLNEVRNKYFKKTIQTISYMPFFISMVVIAGIIVDFTGSNGVISQIVSLFGGEKKNWLSKPEYFRAIFVSSNIWQNMGFNSIIYLAAIAGVDQELYQAASLDGAGRWKQMWHITLPGISSTIITLLILRTGSLLSVGSEKILLLYSPLTYKTADIISTFVYRKGLQEFKYDFSTAVGLFNSVISLSLIVFSNKMSRKFSETSLF